LGSTMGFMQVTGHLPWVKMFLDGGVALGVSGLFIQTHLSLKCRPRHLYHPQGSTGMVPQVAL
jgi:hypothetical protein